MGMFVKELFSNMCIMFALLFWCEQVVYKQQNLVKSSLKVSVKIGCITGVFGCILMLFKMSFFGNIYIDYRSIAIVLSALTGGVGAVIITGVIMAMFRLFIHGISFVSIIATVSILIAVSGCSFLIGKVDSQSKKWAMLYSYTTLCSVIAIIIVMSGDVLLVETLLTMVGMNVIGGLIGYWLYQYVHLILQE